MNVLVYDIILPEYHRASIRHNSLAGVYECVSSVYARACDYVCVRSVLIG